VREGEGGEEKDDCGGGRLREGRRFERRERRERLEGVVEVKL